MWALKILGGLAAILIAVYGPGAVLWHLGEGWRWWAVQTGRPVLALAEVVAVLGMVVGTIWGGWAAIRPRRTP